MERPLPEVLRPRSLAEMIGQKHLLKEGALFRRVIQGPRIPNMIFYGPPGTGKTTLAGIIAADSGLHLHRLNGTAASTKDIKDIIADVGSILNTKGILIYLDEIQYLNKKQQQSLLEFVESGDITLIAATTENPFFYVYPALLSRCLVFEFKSLSKEEIEEGLLRAAGTLPITLEDDACQVIARAAGGDLRKALNCLDFLSMALKDKKEPITKKMADELLGRANVLYDRSEDHHYDTLSAFMKSLRGSDPDAAVFYLARLLAGGDLIAACRRLLCSAAEDVGLAYPQIIPVVKAAVDTALQLGLPEARLPLANAAILIATSPKSNSAMLAIDAASEDIRKGQGNNVPRSLQNTHCDGADTAIKGQHYLYPHDYPFHYVKQQYLPDDLKDRKYYRPGMNKTEQAALRYAEKIKNGSS